MGIWGEERRAVSPTLVLGLSLAVSFVFLIIAGAV
jgi:preprotein translocase subunit Sec61beta